MLTELHVHVAYALKRVGSKYQVLLVLH